MVVLHTGIPAGYFVCLSTKEQISKIKNESIKREKAVFKIRLAFLSALLIM